MGQHHDMCMRGEELEYSMTEEVASNAIYKAPPVNRFRLNYRLLHMCSVLVDLGAEDSFSLRLVQSSRQPARASIVLEAYAADAGGLLPDGRGSQEHWGRHAGQRERARCTSACS